METPQTYSGANRLFSGRFFSSGPIDVGQGDRVGVVLLVPGAPESKSEVFPYLYRRFMLPGLKSSGVKYWISHLRSRLKARLATPRVISEYKAIGGGSSINRFNVEQAEDLSRRLQESAMLPEGVKVSTYLASPFGSPSMKDAALQMSEEGITHVVLLPLFPQYAADTTGRALAHWEKMVTRLEIASRPTVAVWEFAVRDTFISALNERIDQALQRFPRQIRSNVTLLFAANGKAEKPYSKKGDPYCCLVHHTVDQVMETRSNDRPFALSFVQKRGWGTGFANRLKVNLDRIAGSGVRAVLVVPVDHVTEQFDTAYLLDVEVRKLAEEKGIVHYQVAAGLNCHALFMEGLTDMVLDSLVSTSSGRPHAGVPTTGGSALRSSSAGLPSVSSPSDEGSSDRMVDEACIQACPREKWTEVVPSGYSTCNICPFGSRAMEKGHSRPSKSHAHALNGAGRPVVEGV